jgi:ABC-2 type transport system ATP-binding protein
MSAALQTARLGKRYGRRWALRDCTLAIPGGRVAGLVGPNGAGKTTLLHLAVGLLAPTSGTIGRLGLDPRQRAGSLSGGQRAQLALTLALAKRPELLILDEPVASLDPLARRDFLRGLMEAVAEHGVSVVLSSHLVADLERVCDYLVVLVASRVRVAGEVSVLLASHHRLSGPRRDPGTLPATQEVIEESHTDRQSTLLVRTDEPVHDPSWTVKPVSLEELVLAYMSRALDDRAPRLEAVP